MVFEKRHSQSSKDLDEFASMISRARQAANQCVRCGLCLPTCPTYALYRDEGHSPRGRIALGQALLKNRARADAMAFEMLDSCLSCRRCEQVCPLQVPVLQILHAGLACSKPYQGLKSRFLRTLLQHTRVAQGMVRLGRLLPAKTTWGSLARVLKGKSAFHSRYLPKGHRPRQPVVLFSGCTGRLLDAQAIEAAMKILNHLQVDVHLLGNAFCCGAADAHAGDWSRAERLQARSISAIRDLGQLPVLSVASGCGAHLDTLLPLQGQHEDIFHFIGRVGGLESLTFTALPLNVALHVPCSQSQEAPMLRLLERIPRLRVHVLDAALGCCGAAGMKFLHYPDNAQRLRAPLLAQIQAVQPDYVLSANPACALHIQLGLNYPRARFLHPLTLLARQLSTNS